MKKQKLELTWIGKEVRPKLEPRILLEDPARSYVAASRITANDQFDNRLIFGDNLLALKALEAEFTGQVKCIYIDPPYNTGSAFEHYDDGIEHSLWLSLMRDRLELLRKLLRDDGTIWVTIDDHECHYLKLMLDDIFGRDAFVSSVVWENFYGRSNAAAISPSHNYLLVYSPMGLDWKNVRRLLPRDEKSASKYINTDNDPNGPWRLGPIFAAEERHEGLMYEVETPSRRKVRPPKGSHWRMVESEFWDLATQTVNHFKRFLKDEFEVQKVLRVHQKPIAAFIHTQMMDHFSEETTGYDVEVSKGFTELRTSAYTANAKDTVLDYRQPPADKSKIAQYLYSGFDRCLYRLSKFQSDTERKLAIILERNAKRWFRPAKGQFQIICKVGHDHQEYLPDFVAETDDMVLMIETKKASEMTSADVLAKRDAGMKWCEHASAYASQHRGKPWRYVLIPHDLVAENMTLAGLLKATGGN